MNFHDELQVFYEIILVFAFDEQRIELHFYDFNKLLNLLIRLIKISRSVIMVKHEMDAVKIMPIGINLVSGGTPDNIVKVKEGYSGKFLKKKLNRNNFFSILECYF